MVDEIAGTWGTGHQIAPLSVRYPDFGVTDAYRKIGLTNRSFWEKFNARAPMWGYMYASTVHELAATGSQASLDGLAEPRIGPEIVIGLSCAPTPDMDERALLTCIEWIAHGFEIGHSIFPGWDWIASDAVAAFGLHGALWIGPRHTFAARPGEWARELSAFEANLFRNGSLADHGHAANVLDGPLHALRSLVAALATDAHNPPLAAGEIVTTGSLTRALPIAAADVWTTELSGIRLEGARLVISDATISHGATP